MSIESLHQACNAVREYRGSELSKHIDDMLTSLAESYRDDLEEVTEGRLIELQTKLKQTMAILRIVRGEIGVPKI